MTDSYFIGTNKKSLQTLIFVIVSLVKSQMLSVTDLAREVIVKINPPPPSRINGTGVSPSGITQITWSAVQSQQAVTAYFSSGQLVPFGFAEQWCSLDVVY